MWRDGCLLTSVVVLWILSSGNHVTRGDHLTFIRNMERLRANLLNASRYNVKVRPTRLVTVKVGLSVLALNVMDIKLQEMSVTGWLSMEWEDRRLTWDPSQYDNIRHIFDTEEAFWRPEIIVDNSIRNVGVLSDRHLNIRVRYDGEMLWEPPALFDTSCSVDVTYYPFDEQRCAVHVVSWVFTKDEVKLAHLFPTVHMDDFVENGEWTFVETEITDSVVVDGDHGYSMLSFWLTFRRRPVFLLLSVLLPVALTSMLFVLVFEVPLDSGEKAQYILTTMLSYVVLQSGVSTKLPSSSLTLSPINVYMAATIFLGSLAVVMTLENLWFFHHPSHPPPPPWLLSYANSVMLKAVKFHRNPKVKVTHKVQQDEWSSSSEEKMTAPPRPDDVITEDRNGAGDVSEALTWQDLARLHDAFCYRIFVVLLVLITSTILLALVIGGYSKKHT